MASTSLPQLPTAAGFWAATGYLVFGCTLFAFLAQNWALKHLAPTRVALLTGSEPLFGACFAVLWLGERLSPIAWAGGALILLSTWIAMRRN
jgi:drug/metabolite transporter (DMT)-like permease